MVFGDAEAETAAIRHMYYAYPPFPSWLTADQYWEALCRTARQLGLDQVGRLEPGRLAYWLAAMLRQQQEGGIRDMQAAAEAQVPADEAQFVRAWLEHAQHVVRRAQGLDQPTEASSEEEEDSAQASPDRRPPDAPSTSADPPPQPTRRSTRRRRRIQPSP